MTQTDSAQIRDMGEQKYVSDHPPEFYWRHQDYARKHSVGLVYIVLRFILPWPVKKIFRAEVQGLENVPESGAVILAANHNSFLDHFFIGMWLKRRARFMAKANMFDNRFKARFFRNGGVFPICRGQRDLYAIITAILLLMRDKAMIIMYPQGGRSREGTLPKRAKAGVGEIALRSGATIVPVAIEGSQHMRKWKHLRCWLRGEVLAPVTVRCGRPIYVEQVVNPTRAQCRDLATYVWARIREEHEQIAA
jgi:1-acyl-sn-glycerol-3-phosphate acyltransferase